MLYRQIFLIKNSNLIRLCINLLRCTERMHMIEQTWNTGFTSWRWREPRSKRNMSETDLLDNVDNVTLGILTNLLFYFIKSIADIISVLITTVYQCQYQYQYQYQYLVEVIWFKNFCYDGSHTCWQMSFDTKRSME
jgi:hypothetical protein